MFCQHSVFVCSVWISEQTAIISLYNINWLVFIIKTERVYFISRNTKTLLYKTLIRPVLTYGCYLNKMNIVLVSLRAKSSGEFMAQWWIGEAGELELTKNSTNCVVRMTFWNSASWVDWDGRDMSYARMTIYPEESSSVSQGLFIHEVSRSHTTHHRQ
jgi:hypothetical protein